MDAPILMQGEAQAIKTSFPYSFFHSFVIAMQLNARTLFEKRRPGKRTAVKMALTPAFPYKWIWKMRYEIV